MEKIQNHNCNGLCIEATCSKKATHFHRINLNRLDLFLTFCSKHADEFEMHEVDW